jgi:hypothetical protein
MTERAALLDYADQVLDGKVPVGSSGARTAALLARCALEEWLDEQSASWSISVESRPTTKSKFIALEALQSAEDGERARRVWSALSRTVHHHAYELQPSVADVRHLVNQVRGLDRGLGAN